MKRKLKFIHITKTAGTSIENEGQLNNVDWGRFHKEYGWWHEVFPNKNKKLKDKYDWFMVVRNPYERMVSEFHCEWGGVGIKLRKYNKLMFNRYLAHKIVNCHSPFIFEGKRYIGKHYTPQHLYLDKDCFINVLKLENLNKDFDKLMKKYSLQISINQKANVSKRKFEIEDINENVKDLIKITYEKDFEKFNYKINQ